ncbi:hypothetical protein [Caulobacter sp. RL271]|jgi:hypothetical protein|uniref:DUF4089 domain-containing protein n=1 Tax=Caulobacter segnis TaxID=88688 RepID=A0ABY4ZPR2_9CAUL|nr:hypothetical protein [Caulobacter segnis]USQ94696.1 hypothetical protein MZV50_19240 [Caulobacter segnis]
MAPGTGLNDADTQGFLDLKDAEVAPWTAARAAERDLVLPPAILPGVIDNVALLRAQSALFIAALQDRVGNEAAAETPETFQP